MAANDFRVDVMEHVGVLAVRENGWRKEVNIVSWNGGTPKLDIRDWDSSRERMSRGLALSDDEARKLAELLSKRYC